MPKFDRTHMKRSVGEDTEFECRDFVTCDGKQFQVSEKGGGRFAEQMTEKGGQEKKAETLK